MGFSEKQCGPFVKMEVAWPEGGACREGLGDEVGLGSRRAWAATWRNADALFR